MEDRNRLLAEHFSNGQAEIKENCVRISTPLANKLKFYLGEVGWVLEPQGGNQTLLLYYNRDNSRRLLIETLPLLDGEDRLILVERMGLRDQAMKQLDEDEEIAGYWLNRMLSADDPPLELAEMASVGHSALADTLADVYEEMMRSRLLQ